MEKRKKSKFQKLIAMISIFVILQSYFLYFAEVAMAIDDLITPGGIYVDQDLGGDEEPEKEPEESDMIVEDAEEENISDAEEPEEPEEPEEEQPEEQENQEEPQDDPQEPQEGEEEQEQEPEAQPGEEIIIEDPEEEEPYVEPEISVEVTSENTSIYKGYLYANATSSLRYATDYNTIDRISLTGAKNMTKVSLQDDPDKIQFITNTKISLANEIFYRQTRVSVEDFEAILGNTGHINVYNPNDELIGTINQETEIKNAEYVFTYDNQYNSVRFELNGLKRDGTIEIKNDKTIKESSDFSRNQISLFSTINTVTQVSLYIGEEVRSTSYEGNINLEETESRMTIDMDVQDLSVEGQNEVSINVTLKTDEERYDLFENPTIDLEFPLAVEEVEVTGMMLLYKNGLSIENWDVATNAAGKKVLKINLTGSQMEYTPGAVQEGTTVVIYTNLDVNRLTADTSENLKMTYTNKDTIRKTYALEGKDSEDISLNFIGRQELVRAMTITNELGESKTSYDNDTDKIQIEANKEQELTITSTIVNNYEATLDDVVVIGRIPFKGNKDGNGNDLGTNFDCYLENAVATSGAVADVYYSTEEQPEATSDSWTQEVEDFSLIKSYKIVVREKTLAKGERLSFEYTLRIPEEVSYNAKGYSSYTVYYKIDTQNYTNECLVGIYTEEKEIEMEDITEEEQQDLAELTIGTQVSACGTVLGENDTVYERQTLEYTLVVKNTSDKTAENIVLKCNAENANLYYFKSEWYDLVNDEYYEEGIANEEASVNSEIESIYIGDYVEDINGEKGYEEFVIPILKSGESRTFSYQVIIKEKTEETDEVYGRIAILGDNIKEEIVETIKNKINDGKLELRFKNAVTVFADKTQRYYSDNTVKLTAYIKNISNEKLNNIDMILNFSEYFYIDEKQLYLEGAEGCERKLEENANGSKYIITIPSLEPSEERNIGMVVYTKKINTSLENAIIKAYSRVDLDSETYYSNLFNETINQATSTYEYSWTSDFAGDTLSNNDTVTYTFKIKNTGLIDIESLGINNNVPKGLALEKLIANGEDLEVDPNSKTIQENFSLKKGEEIEIKIITKVNASLFERDQSVIENKLQVGGGRNFETFETDVISYKIDNKNITSSIVEVAIPEPENANEAENINNNSEQAGEQQTNISQQSNTYKTTYIISGMAWVDSNQDGIRGQDEKPREAVIAYLYKANSNGGLDTSNLLQTTATITNGTYSFSNVEEGNYIIVFDYNSDIYKVTKYQVASAKSTENSDAISKKVTIGNESRILAVTDVLTVNNSSLTSIDIGLVDKTNFDLSLSKAITSVTVKNNEGTKTYNFGNQENTRLEIRSKYYKSSVVDIAYNFQITNEGDVAGYVNKVVDYLPDDVEVVLNSSPDWYIGSDNGLYYTGLVDKEIGSGETKEFSLVLRKSLANGEAVKLVNSAEIVEYTNNLGLYDRDSIENNKMETEDDFGKAILIISVSTGNTKQYITTTLIIIIMVAVIIAMIIKLKTTKKVYR